jgi:hypothetical protein
MAQKEPWALVESSKRVMRGGSRTGVANATEREEGIGSLSALVITCRDA